MTLTEFYNKVNPSVGVAQIVFNHLFKEFPVKKIKDVASTTSGGTPDRGNPEYWYGGKIPWVKSGETNDGLITQFEETITEKALANSSAKLFPKGTLLVAMYGATAGKTGILDFESTTNQALCAVFPNALVERDYLFWFFRQRRFGYLQESFGGAQPNISQTIIKDTSIPVPDLKTQREIVSFLEKSEANGELDVTFKFKTIFIEITKFFNYRSAYDALLLSQASQFSLLTSLRQAILTEAVKGQLTAQWREENPNQEPASELLKRIAAEKAKLIKEKKIGKEKPLAAIKEEEVLYALPEEWAWCRLGDVIISMTAGKSPQCENRPASLDEWGVLKTTSIQNLFFDESENKALPTNITISPNIEVKVNDILITRAGPKNRVGIVCAVKQTRPMLLLSDKTVRIKTVDKIIFPEMLAMLLSTGESEKFIESKKSGMAESQVNISQDNIRLTPVPLPTQYEQYAIVQKFNNLMAYCDELEQQVQKSKVDLDLLMQSVLSEVFGTENQASGSKTSSTKLSERETLIPSEINHTFYNENAFNMELEEVLLQNGGKMDAFNLWKMSKYQKDIDSFYEALKKEVEEKKSIRESPEKGYIELNTTELEL